MKDISYTFDLPVHHKSMIKVIGVGGGGSNAVNNMYKRGIKDVSFLVCNTDAQALETSPIQEKLQIGATLTGGLGAGANPEVGRNAAVESKEHIKEILGQETKMLFITAGMGGGTGTGAAPVIADIARKQNILTVGIVTLPFSFEGKKKLEQAQVGINQLRKHCDTVLIILNDKIQATLGGLSVSQAFLEADNVLTTAAKSIAEIITVPGYVNVDFEDVKTVMQHAGAAVMGSGQADGEQRALQATELALSSPLLDYNDVRGAKKILLSIVSGQDAELQMDELTAITGYIQEQTGQGAEMIFGHGSDPEIRESIRVTVIATGFDQQNDLHPVNKQLKLGPPHHGGQVEHRPSMASGSLQQEPIKGNHLNKPLQLQLPLPFHAPFQEDSHTIDHVRGVRKMDHLTSKKWNEHHAKAQLEIPTFLRKKIVLQKNHLGQDQVNMVRYPLYDHEQKSLF